MPDTSEKTEKTEVGKLAGIEEKDNGWFQLKIDVANLKYPVVVATKRESIVKDARELRGQICTWTITEKESDRINEKSGKPYINRYLESVEEGGVVSSNGRSSSTAGGNGEEMTKAEWDAKERRSFMSRTWAQTLATFEHTIAVDDDPILVFEKLRPFQRKLYADVVGNFAQPEDAPGGPVNDEPPVVDDDDIPF